MTKPIVAQLQTMVSAIKTMVLYLHHSQLVDTKELGFLRRTLLSVVAEIDKCIDERNETNKS